MPIQESHSATLDRLESELNSVLEQDSRYWTENDAKFRAVAQNVSYEQFEEIVKASHLKPLEKNDKSQLSNPKNTIWNSVSNYTREKIANAEVKTTDERFKIIDEPKNVAEFYTSWRSKEPSDRISFIKDIGQSKLKEIFATEVPSELLVDIVETFHNFKDSEIIVVVQTLELLSETKRFSLTVEFLSKREKQAVAVAELMERLRISLVDSQQDLAELEVTEWNIENIARRFKVH